ncbi:MAG: chloride channel protein [Clostridia bacterium]|nr:chloride channel protein [Clostridia bacterium]
MNDGSGPAGEAGLSARTIPGPQSRPWFARLRGSAWLEPSLLLLLAVLVGVIGGLGAILFRWMIAAVGTGSRLLVGGASASIGLPPRLLAPLSTTAGLVVVGAITTYAAREVKGHGVPQILEALALRGGRIRPRVALFGILAPAVTIGSGGSVGQEGPIALIGASFGSVLGQLLRLGDKHISLLLACGSAAGIAATFHAPIAGALFGLEVVLGSYAMGAIVPVFVAALTGSLTFGLFMGERPVLPAPDYAVHGIGLIAPMLLLGLLAGLLGIAYTRGITLSEDLFERLGLPWWARTALGGLAVGLLGVGLPQVLGVGYPTLEAMTASRAGLGLVALLLAGKYLATLVTIGAGGSGGVFAPSLFLGSALGSLFGQAGRALSIGGWPAPGLFSVAGMGAVFAASAQAPLTATTIILEMTGDYRVAPAAMAACAVAYLLHGSLLHDSMYTVRLSRRGIMILRGSDVRPTERIRVRTAMSRLNRPLDPATTVSEAARLLGQHRRERLFLDDGRAVGAAEIRQALDEGRGDEPVGKYARADYPWVGEEASLEEAMRLFALLDAGELAVVREYAGRREVVGVLTQGAVLKAYSTQTLLSMETSTRIARLREERADAGAFGEVVLPPGSPAVGKRLAELALPESCLVVSLRRRGQLQIPHGQTLLEPDDRLLLFCAPAEQVERVAARLAGRASAGE